MSDRITASERAAIAAFIAKKGVTRVPRGASRFDMGIGNWREQKAGRLREMRRRQRVMAANERERKEGPHV